MCLECGAAARAPAADVVQSEAVTNLKCGGVRIELPGTLADSDSYEAFVKELFGNLDSEEDFKRSLEALTQQNPKAGLAFISTVSFDRRCVQVLDDAF